MNLFDRTGETSARASSNIRVLLRSLLLLLAVALAGPGPAFGDFWYEHYDEALDAIKDEDWPKAIEQLTEAIAKKGDSGARARASGMRTVPYFPYLKLGIAYYNLGQPDAALQAFQTEETLGAVTEDLREAKTAYTELQKFRGKVEETRQATAAATAADEAERIQEIVRESLGEAKTFEESGQLDEAIEALGVGLAVDPDSSEARAVLERLQSKVAQRQEESERKDRVERLIEQGRTLLEQGKYNEASRSFRQAGSLDPDDKRAESLLEQAQSRLRTELEQQQDTAQRQLTISDGLTQARQLADAGKLQEALDQLETVNALGPGNRESLDFQEEVLAARQKELDVQAEDEADDERLAAIRKLLDEAATELESGSARKALSAANRALALDRNPATARQSTALDLNPNHATAQQYAARAYEKINRELLVSEVNLPPAISFSEFREVLPDGTRGVQRVKSRYFQLSGLVIDDPPVTIVLRDESGVEVPSTSSVIGDITQFTLTHQLLPGSSSFQLAVSDGELKSSAEYGVDYTPPFYLARTFHAAVGAAALAVFSFLAWRRARKRKQRLQRRDNPYIAGAPILEEDLFFGRDQLMDRILRTIHNNSLLLYGERRIGKTSLQHHLKQRLEELQDPKYEFFPVFIDLQGTPQDKFFSTLAEDVFAELAPVLGDLEQSAGGSEGYSHRDLDRDLRQVLKILQQKSSKSVKLVLLMDEVDELNNYDPRINQKLRSLFMKRFAQNLVTVVSGVAIRKQWESEGSPWYNFFEEIEVTPFREEDARDLIEGPIRGLFKLEEGVVDRIISMTGCKPYLIQKLCIALVNLLYEENRRKITLTDVEAVGLPEEA